MTSSARAFCSDLEHPQHQIDLRYAWVLAKEREARRVVGFHMVIDVTFSLVFTFLSEE